MNLVLEYPESRPPSEWDEAKYVDEVRAEFAGWDSKSVTLISLYGTCS